MPGICHCGAKTRSKKKRQSLAKYFKAKEFIITVQTRGFSQKICFYFHFMVNETSLKRKKLRLPRKFDISERFTDNVNNKQLKENLVR